MFQDSQVVVYNQSKHATNSVLADIRAVWGSRVRVIQTLEVPWDPIQTQVHPDFIFISGRRFSIYSDIFYIFIWVILRFSHHITDKISGYLLVVSPFPQEGNQRLPGMDAALYVRPKSWGYLDHFKERLDFMCTQEREGWWRMVKDGEGWWRMVKDGEGWWRMVKDGEGWWRMVKDGEGWWRMVKDGEGWWRMVKDGEGWWRMVKDGEGRWRTVKDGEGWWRMVKDGEGWWRMVKDGEGWWRMVKDGEGWWRMVKDGEGWWRMVKGHRFIGPSIYVYIYIYQQYINIYQHIVGCWMIYIDYIGGYIGWWTIWSLFFGDGVEIRLQRGCPFQATECQDLIVENLIVTPFSCSG